MKELLLAETATIQDEQLACFVRLVLDHVPEAFFTLPASTSGKYHPAQSLGKGGLVRHVIAACYFGRELCRAYSCPEEQDVVVAALILHDVAKAIGEPHDLVGEKWLQSIIEKYKLPMNEKMDKVLDGVRFHMGPWAHGACQSKTEKNLKVVFPEQFSRTTQIVHLADYVSSRREVVVMFLPGAPNKEIQG